MKNRNWFIMLVVIVVLAIPVAALAAQDGGRLQLGLTRNFGYGGLGKIQGNFTLKITDPPAGLKEVQFYMDGELLAAVDEQPFEYKFHTSSFEDGERILSAVGILIDGTAMESNHISKEFLSSEQAWGETQQIIGPLLIGTAVLTLIGVALPMWRAGKRYLCLESTVQREGLFAPAAGCLFPGLSCLPIWLLESWFAARTAGKSAFCPERRMPACRKLKPDLPRRMSPV